MNKKSIIRYPSILAILLLGAYLLTPKPSTAQSSYCTVDYTLQNDWGSGSTVEVTISNLQTTSINGWTLAWDFSGNQQISNLWNASYDQTGTAVSVSDIGWNGNIAPGGTASFGFNMNYSGSNAIPTEFTVNGLLCGDVVLPPTATSEPATATATQTAVPPTATDVVPTATTQAPTATATNVPPTATGTAVPPTATVVVPTATATTPVIGDPDCTVDYTVSSWETGFQGDVTITNLTNQPIQGYMLNWDYTAGQSVTSSWNADVTQSGTTVSASNVANHWNGTISANGGTVSFGLQGTHNGNNPNPTNFTLNGQACNGDAPQPTATPDNPTQTPVAPTATPDNPTPTPTTTPGDYPYQDPSLPVPDRVADLLSRMTLAEKIGQMTQADHLAVGNVNDVTSYGLGSILSGGSSEPPDDSPAGWANLVDNFQQAAMSTRLEIPLLYGIDAVHGHSNVRGATIFPHNIGIGASRNPVLAQQIGEVTAKEVYATGIKWTFSPCLCVARDERWGRTYESFGEDPEIASMMTTIIDGYQGTDLSAPNTVLATAKHWVGDGGTTNGIDQGNTQISEAELRAIHIPPYADAIQRNIGSIMPSYSSWNGTKLHASDYLMNDVLRQEMGFAGFIISDWAAIDQIPGDYNSDVRTAVNAGVDMVMVPNEYQQFISTLTTEVNAGNVSMARIDEAVSRILTAKFELGLFEQPYSDRTHIGDVGSQAHRDVARQAVRESLVLLKNNNALPLAANTGELLVAGAHANDIGLQSGGWTISWQGSSGNITPGTTILEGIQNHAPSGTNVTYIASPQQNQLANYDKAIVVVGEQPYAEGQGDDTSLQLSSADSQLIANVCGAMDCVVVLVSGRPLMIETQITQADAFVAAWLPGTEGDGVAEVLFGDYNFTGTLPITWPRNISQLPINVGDADYDPLFAYGHGLTYP